jgi:hypothetical protein
VQVGESAAADLLALSPGRTTELAVTVGAPVGDPATLPATPRMRVVVETGTADALTSQTLDITLSGPLANPAAVAAELQNILRASLTQVFVRVAADRLVVYALEAAGEATVALRFLPHPDDRLTVRILGLLSSLPAIGYDAAGFIPGPESRIEETTIIGPVMVRALQLASNSIFTDTVACLRRQVGCVRFSYVPPASITPRRYRCQPDRAIKAADGENEVEAAVRRVMPEFTTRRYGQPAYAQLSLDCVEEIRAGADNGAEMGVFNMLMQPQREANLHVRLEEYLPFGLEAGLIFVT